MFKYISVSSVTNDRLQYFDNTEAANEYARQLVDLYGAGNVDMIEFESEESMLEYWRYFDE